LHFGKTEIFLRKGLDSKLVICPSGKISTWIAGPPAAFALSALRFGGNLMPRTGGEISMPKASARPLFAITKALALFRFSR
jgi:hypothetical protein